MSASIFFAGFHRIDSFYVFLCQVAFYMHNWPPIRTVRSEQAWCGELPYRVLRDLSHEEVAMSMKLHLQDTIGRSVRTRGARFLPAKGTLPESSVCRERIAGCHTGRWTWDTGNGRTALTFHKKQIIFSQGDAAGTVFYIQAGQIKLTVVSPQGKEAVIAMLERGAFLGESCLAGQTVRPATATAVEDSRLVRIDKEVMIRLLHEEPAFSELFLTHLLSRNMRIQEDVVDHLFNSSEKRLARVLLLLAHCEKDGRTEASLPKLSQETLAEMIGTTRARVSFFMKRFRKMGFLLYDNGGWHVHRSLYNVLRHAWCPSVWLNRRAGDRVLRSAEKMFHSEQL